MIVGTCSLLLIVIYMLLYAVEFTVFIDSVQYVFGLGCVNLMIYLETVLALGWVGDAPARA